MESATKKSVCLPQIGWEYDSYMRKVNCYPYDAYCILISEIPCGMIVTERQLYNCLAKVYGQDDLNIEHCYTEVVERANERYCYWRVVSERGHLISRNDKEFQRQKLEGEGLTVYEIGSNSGNYAVRDYKSHLFDFDSLHITARVSLNDCFEKPKMNE